MIRNIHDRIKSVIKYSELGNVEFSKLCKIPYVSLYACISGTRPANLDMVQKICEKFPEINERWLILGEGMMLSDQVLAALKRRGNQ
jgi:predicted transcriptional regulator